MMNKLSIEDDLDNLTPSKIEEEGNILKDLEMDNELDMSKQE